MDDRRGLIIVHTGDGKGKTTAALGLAIRAHGAGLNVLVLQFIKGLRRSGELNALDALGIEVRQLGLGFTSAGDINEHRAAARLALDTARAEISSGAWDLIVLDEINYAVKFNLLTAADITALLTIRPPQVHLVFTGRDAPPQLINAADLVTEMKLVKHPFQRGVEAQAGIEF